MKGIQQIHKKCTHGEVDITIVFGTIMEGSSPSGCTKRGKCTSA